MEQGCIRIGKKSQAVSVFSGLRIVTGCQRIGQEHLGWKQDKTGSGQDSDEDEQKEKRIGPG